MFWCTKAGNTFCTDTKIYTVPGGTQLTMLCWRDDRSPFPNSSPRWFYVWLDNGVEGYMWAPQVKDQAIVPHCNSYGSIRSTDWAIDQLNKAGPAPTATGRWSGWCASFVYYAWEPFGNTIPMKSPYNAITWHNQYAAPGDHPGVAGRSRPPRGAIVWFAANSGNGWDGHVALSLGNWQMITTQGLSTDNKVVTVKGILDYDKHTKYLGWSMANNQANAVPWNNNNNGVVS